MCKFKNIKKNMLLIAVATMVTLSNTTISSHAEEITDPAKWIQANWLNYPSDIGKWTTNTINGNSALGSTQNVNWSGFLNEFAIDTKDSVFEFKMYQNDTGDDDNMGWTFRHNYVGSYANVANHSFYAFITNGISINGANIPSGLYKKSVGKNIAWNPNHNMELLQGINFGRAQKTLYNIKIDVKDEVGGTRIKGWIDGKEVLNYLDKNPIPNGGYGPFSYSQAHAYYYDMNINGSSVYNIPPSITVTSPAQNQQYLPTDKISLVGSANDVDNRGTLSTYYQFDDKTQQLIWTKPQTGVAQSFNLSLAIPSDFNYGNHKLTVWAKDSENAESQKQEINFFVKDIIKPSATHTVTAGANNTKTITINAMDFESGVKRIKLPSGSYVNGATATYSVPNTNADYSFVIEDIAGNLTTYVASVSDVAISPVLSVTPNNSLNNIDLVWTMNDNWQTYSYTVFRKKYGDSAFSTVKTGITTTSYKDLAGTDVSKPNTPNISSVVADGKNSTVKIDYSASQDNGTTYSYYVQSLGAKNTLKANSNTVTKEIISGIKGYSIVIDNNTSTTPDNVIETTSTSYTVSRAISGKFYVHIASVDNSGNISEVAHYQYLDSFTPSLTLTPNTINWTKDNITIVANANDNESGVKRIKLPNGNYVNGETATYSISNNGNYEFVAEDYVGNIFAKTIVVQNIDKTAPTVSHTLSKTPTNGWIDSDVTINITSSDSQSGIKRIKLPDNTYVNAKTGSFKATLNKTYSFEIEDNAGNIKSYPVKIDNLSYKPTITATPNNKEDYINLKWGISDTSQPYTFKLYQDRNNSGSYQSISASNLKDGIKVLNIYPTSGNNITFTNWKGETFTIPKSAGLKKWMEEPNSEDPKGYGKGLISVEPVLLSTFNSNPDSYLKNSDGSWKYDVVMIGTWDCNGSCSVTGDISEVASQSLSEFIESGKGFLTGHDTIHTAHTNLNVLRKYLNVKIGGIDVPSYGNVGNSNTGEPVEIRISKKGLLTNYPWDIGDVGTILSVPKTHTSSQYAYGDIWMKFNEADKPTTDGGEVNSYLSTWNNTAMIQTGHSSGQATPDEQKVFANTLFYLSQLTSDTDLDDRSGQDVNGPTNPVISNFTFKGGVVSLNYGGSVDNKTDYSYYIEALGQNNGAKTNSDTTSTSIISGFKGYSYIVDTNANTIPDNVIESSVESSMTFKLTDKVMYFHVKAVDNVGNDSETIHYKVSDTTAPTLTISGNATEWTKDDITLIATASDSESGMKQIILPNGNVVNGSTANFVASNNGTFVFKAIDLVGNEVSKSVVIDKIDRVPPVLTATKEINANKLSGFININIKDTLSGVDYIVLPDETEVKNVSTYKYPISSNGAYLFAGYDKVGNVSIISVEVTELNANIVPSGIERIEYKLTGATVQDWTIYTSAFYIKNEGITYITARSFDKAGNISLEETSQVKIDKTNPINGGIKIELIK